MQPEIGPAVCLLQSCTLWTLMATTLIIQTTVLMCCIVFIISPPLFIQYWLSVFLLWSLPAPVGNSCYFKGYSLHQLNVCLRTVCLYHMFVDGRHTVVSSHLLWQLCLPVEHENMLMRRWKWSKILKLCILKALHFTSNSYKLHKMMATLAWIRVMIFIINENSLLNLLIFRKLGFVLLCLNNLQGDIVFTISMA